MKVMCAVGCERSREEPGVMEEKGLPRATARRAGRMEPQRGACGNVWGLPGQRAPASVTSTAKTENR